MMKLPPDSLPEAMKALELVGADTPPNEARATFRKLAKKIHFRVKELRESNSWPRSPIDQPLNILRRQAYRLGLHYIETKQVQALTPIFARHHRRSDVPTLDANIFHWVLVQIDPPDVTLAARNKMAKQLLYAYRHAIPAYLLTGFLYQIRDRDKISEKVAKQHFETWHPKYDPAKRLT